MSSSRLPVRVSPARLFRRLVFAGVLLAPGLLSCTAGAQISLSTAVNLALQNSPRVKIAQADLDRAKAVLSETRDAFVPAVSANAGVGREVGAPLSPPVVFRADAQSLVFSLSQPDYVRAARSGVRAAQLALDTVRADVSEDTINTYLALDNISRRRAIEVDEATITSKLVAIVDDRFSAGIDPHIELSRVKRTAAQITLALVELDDGVAFYQEHLALLTALPAAGWETVSDSVPLLKVPTKEPADVHIDPQAYEASSPAFANARARQYTARGDKRALQTPQFSFSANYSRISDAFTSYDTYYPGFRQDLVTGALHSFNSLSAGVQLTLPILDMVRRAKARESAADAAHALLDAKIGEANYFENGLRGRHAVKELAARVALTSLDHDLAQDELDALRLRLQAANGVAGGPQLSPKDELNARLTERQRIFDTLNLELQLHQAEVTLMRQEGSLATYLAASIPGLTAAPAAVPSAIAPPGTAPGVELAPGNAAGGVTTTESTPATAPTTGTAPSSLPSAPVPSAPSSAPGSAPPPTSPASPHS